MNAVEKAKIAKDVANYIVEHLIIEEPLPSHEIESIAISVAEDRVTADTHEIGEIVTYAKSYLSSDPRVLVTAGEDGKPRYFFSPKTL